MTEPALNEVNVSFIEKFLKDHRDFKLSVGCTGGVRRDLKLRS
jgi:hypothetical protein